MNKSKTKIYAKALAEVIAKGPVSAQEASAWQINFVKILVKAGLEKRANEILDLSESMILKNKGNKKIIFEAARRLTRDNKALLKQFVKEGDIVKEKINRELIAGVKVIVDGERQLDYSMQDKLQSIF